MLIMRSTSGSLDEQETVDETQAAEEWYRITQELMTSMLGEILRWGRGGGVGLRAINPYTEQQQQRITLKNYLTPLENKQSRKIAGYFCIETNLSITK